MLTYRHHFFGIEATFKASGVPAASEDAAGGVGFKFFKSFKSCSKFYTCRLNLNILNPDSALCSLVKQMTMRVLEVTAAAVEAAAAEAAPGSFRRKIFINPDMIIFFGQS